MNRPSRHPNLRHFYGCMFNSVSILTSAANNKPCGNYGVLPLCRCGAHTPVILAGYWAAATRGGGGGGGGGGGPCRPAPPAFVCARLTQTRQHRLRRGKSAPAANYNVPWRTSHVILLSLASRRHTGDSPQHSPAASSVTSTASPSPRPGPPPACPSLHSPLPPSSHRPVIGPPPSVP